MEIKLPERQQPGRDSFPTSFWGRRRWLREFAEARAKDRVELLTQALEELHRLAVPPARRLRTLQALMPAVRGIVDELARRVSGQSLPLPIKTRTTLQSNLRMLERFARGFDAVVADEAAAARPSLKRIALAAQMALNLRGELFLRCAQVYTVPPGAFWRSAHAVYLTAENARAANRRIRPLTGERRRKSPATEYARILLFAVARTEGLRRGQIWPLFKALGEWAQHTPIQRAADFDGGDSQRVIVDLDKPKPPLFRAPAADTEGDGIRLLAVDPLVEKLDRALEEAPGDETAITDPDTLRAHTARQLLNVFRQSAARASERETVRESVEVEVGVRAIHARLEQLLAAVATKKRAEENEEKNEEGKNVESGRRDQRPDLSSSAQLALQTIAADEPEPQQAFLTHPGHDQMVDQAHAWEDAVRGQVDPGLKKGSIDSSAVAPAAAAEQWRLEDSSRGGFRLRWEAEHGSRATVGELIALRDGQAAAEAPHWKLGVVRWLQFIDDRRFHLGAERVPGRPRPATIRSLPDTQNRKRHREREPTEPALFFAADRQQQRPATVIVPAHLFQSGQNVEIDVADRVLPVCLGEVQEQTNCFARYRLRAQAKKEPVKPKQEPPSQPIWDDP